MNMWDVLEKWGYMFYIVSPNKTTFETIEDVPEYLKEVIGSLGPLEYILNTASLHRVHHGRNRICIDKNFAGTLIIWDRMFGTFEKEKQVVTYGITHPITTLTPWNIQFCHYVHIWKTAWNIKGWKNKLSVIFKGPGWTPGTPWTGNINDIPEVPVAAPKYDPPSPKWLKIYVCIHFLLILIFHVELMERYQALPKTILYSGLAYQMLSLSIISIVLEGRVYAPWLELMRCIAYFTLDLFFLPHSSICLLPPIYQLLFTTMVRIIFISSTMFWLTQNFNNVTINLRSGHKKFD